MKNRYAKKKQPVGFVAICQCGKIIGAMDYQRTPPKQAGKILGEWLHNGCKVEPRFECFSETIEPCDCDQ